ncbi:HMG box protein [Rutstroemia sp. NJR-2017a BVV2]|nr:HMG box protein [Rutstroemia sp. NJR-2017a BVV2]
MLAIGRAAIKRIGGLHPSSNRFLASTWQLQRVEAHQNAAIISRSSSQSLLARRSYATATKSAPAKKPAATATKAAAKKPAARKPAAPKTAAKKPAKKDAKKPAKKPVKKAKAKSKAKPKPKPKPKTKKAPLKESVKLFREKRRLKEVALLAEEPKHKPIAARNVHIQTVLSGTKGKVDLGKAAAEYPALTAAEIERLTHTANENKASNEVAMKKWVATHTPDEIRLANNARQALRKLSGKSVPRDIPDERQPRRPAHALLFFIKDRYASGDFANVKAREALGLIATEWKALPAAQRKVYEDQAAADKLRYWQEVKTVFNRDPPTSASA